MTDKTSAAPANTPNNNSTNRGSARDALTSCSIGITFDTARFWSRVCTSDRTAEASDIESPDVLSTRLMPLSAYCCSEKYIAGRASKFSPKYFTSDTMPTRSARDSWHCVGCEVLRTEFGGAPGYVFFRAAVRRKRHESGAENVRRFDVACFGCSIRGADSGPKPCGVERNADGATRERVSCRTAVRAVVVRRVRWCRARFVGHRCLWSGVLFSYTAIARDRRTDGIRRANRRRAEAGAPPGDVACWKRCRDRSWRCVCDEPFDGEPIVRRRRSRLDNVRRNCFGPGRSGSGSLFRASTPRSEGRPDGGAEIRMKRLSVLRGPLCASRLNKSSSIRSFVSTQSSQRTAKRAKVILEVKDEQLYAMSCLGFANRSGASARGLSSSLGDCRRFNND